MRAGKFIGVLAAMTVAASAMAEPASAAGYDKVRCDINPITGIKLTKYCRAIEAHNSQHWVLIDVDQIARYTEWWLKDLDTGVVVAHGVGDARNRKVYGLYGERYQLKVYGYGTNASAANYT
ncbi:hypothetical protein [Nonomuraea sp. B19D2]|uniref:hypothetical protein n=1 Tax=Nonomuraea sp. B19D2 TaxID=3159561 RepID=UPI0032DB1BCA